jgi:hypothetical protein
MSQRVPAIDAGGALTLRSTAHQDPALWGLRNDDNRRRRGGGADRLLLCCARRGHLGLGLSGGVVSSICFASSIRSRLGQS